jgi:hypothetical protein
LFLQILVLSPVWMHVVPRHLKNIFIVMSRTNLNCFETCQTWFDSWAMLPANLGGVQEPAAVEFLQTSVWDTSDNMIKTKIAKLKFDPRSTEDTTLCDSVIIVIHCNSRRNLQSVCYLKCATLP